MENEPKANPGLSYFDRALSNMQTQPETIKTKETTITVVPTFGFGTYTYVMQTFRQRDIGDSIFLQYVANNETMRIVIPPQVADVIARQRDQLSTKSRSRASRRAMEDRMARGEKPGFLKKK